MDTVWYTLWIHKKEKGEGRSRIRKEKKKER